MAEIMPLKEESFRRMHLKRCKGLQRGSFAENLGNKAFDLQILEDLRCCGLIESLRSNNS